jgi:hypothetical protein
MSIKAYREMYIPKSKDGKRSLVKYTLPDHKSMAAMVHDADGAVILIGSMVTNIMPIESSADTGNVPTGSVLLVETKAGAAFILIDSNGTRHISMGLRLRVVKEGSTFPELERKETEFDAFGIKTGLYAQRGAIASALLTKGKSHKKKKS